MILRFQHGFTLAETLIATALLAVGADAIVGGVSGQLERTRIEQARQEMLAMPYGAKEVALLTRLVLVVPPAKIPAMRQWLFDAIQRLRTEFAVDDPADAASDDQCERWALTLAFAPVRPPAEPRRRRPRK